MIKGVVPALVAVVTWASPVLATDAGKCGEMLKYTGAPEYLGNPPTHQRLCREGYVLSHNSALKVADWVLEVLTKRVFEKNTSRDAPGVRFRPDPDLEKGQRSELKDYRNSKRDRGHMAPAGDMTWKKGAMKESFYLSNMAPQIGIGFNRAIWARLEKKVRHWLKSRERLVVITGPVHTAKDETIGPNNVADPGFFYKIIYDPRRIRAQAFIMPNRNLKGRKIDEFSVSIREVEDRTGLQFLSALSDRTRRILGTKPMQVWVR